MCHWLNIYFYQLVEVGWFQKIHSFHFLPIQSRQILLSFLKPVITLSCIFLWCTYKLGRCFSLQRTNSGSYGQNSSESWIDTIGPKSKRFMWAHLIRSPSDVCIITISIFHCWQRRATTTTLSWNLNHRWMNKILHFLIIKKVIKSKTIHLHYIF